MIGIIIQARTKSSRFPRKIYEKINGRNTLSRVLCGSSNSIIPNKIILAMPLYDKDEFVYRLECGEFANDIDDRFETYFGDPGNLLDRYFRASRRFGINLIIRITADCPFVQGGLIDNMVLKYIRNDYNGYMSNLRVTKISYPGGFGVEIFPYWILSDTVMQAYLPEHFEHVCPFMYRPDTHYNIYPYNNSAPNYIINNKFSDLSFDTKEDLNLIKIVAKKYDELNDINSAIEESNFGESYA